MFVDSDENNNLLAVVGFKALQFTHQCVVFGIAHFWSIETVVEVVVMFNERTQFADPLLRRFLSRSLFHHMFTLAIG